MEYTTINPTSANRMNDKNASNGYLKFCLDNTFNFSYILTEAEDVLSKTLDEAGIDGFIVTPKKALITFGARINYGKTDRCFSMRHWRPNHTTEYQKLMSNDNTLKPHYTIKFYMNGAKDKVLECAIIKTDVLLSAINKIPENQRPGFSMEGNAKFYTVDFDVLDEYDLDPKDYMRIKL